MIQNIGQHGSKSHKTKGNVDGLVKKETHSTKNLKSKWCTKFKIIAISVPSRTKRRRMVRVGEWSRRSLTREVSFGQT